MTEQEILNGAPKNWPVADETGMLDGELVYISNSDNGHHFKVYCEGDNGKVWCHSEDDIDFLYIRNRRSLSDIQTIVDLRGENEKLKLRVKEIAVKQQPDYPDVETQDVYGHLWAIEQGTLGVMQANEDVHAEWEKCKAEKAELEKSNSTLHKLMVSGEKRGIDKATEDFKNKIAELEKERDEANCHAYYILDTCTVFSPKKLQAQNLEQQAKGAQLIVEEIEVMSRATSMRSASQRIAATLRNQAKAIKDGE